MFPSKFIFRLAAGFSGCDSDIKDRSFGEAVCECCYDFGAIAFCT